MTATLAAGRIREEERSNNKDKRFSPDVDHFLIHRMYSIVNTCGLVERITDAQLVWSGTNSHRTATYQLYNDSGYLEPQVK